MGLLVILNNYLHDLAAAMWFSANAVRWLLLSRQLARPPHPSREALDLLNTISIASVVWIVLGGIIRAAAFASYEWSDAAGRGQIALLGFKHVLFIAALAGGEILRRRARRLREETA